MACQNFDTESKESGWMDGCESFDEGVNSESGFFGLGE